MPSSHGERIPGMGRLNASRNGRGDEQDDARGWRCAQGSRNSNLIVVRSNNFDGPVE